MFVEKKRKILILPHINHCPWGNRTKNKTFSSHNTASTPTTAPRIPTTALNTDPLPTSCILGTAAPVALLEVAAAEVGLAVDDEAALVGLDVGSAELVPLLVADVAPDDAPAPPHWLC
jgi:hypothetical protein